MKVNKISQLYASILVNAIYAMKNYPITLINTLLAPLSILIIIVLVSHGALLSVSIEGALIMTMVSGGVSLQGDLSHLKNDFKLQDMVVSSPTSAFMYMAGMAISEIVYSLPAFIVLIVLAFMFIHTTIVGALIIFVILALMFAFSIALGFLLSTLSSDIMQNWAFSSILSIILTTIPPIYYTINYIPLPYRYIAYLSPTTYAAEIVQNAIGYLPLKTSNLIADWLIIIAISIALFVIVMKKNRWRES
jgi:ABC-2 type transport system permease protein